MHNSEEEERWNGIDNQLSYFREILFPNPEKKPIYPCPKPGWYVVSAICMSRVTESIWVERIKEFVVSVNEERKKADKARGRVRTSLKFKS
jgi:hypothetical protein